MILLDANYILRYLLGDHPDMFEIAKEVINNNMCMVLLIKTAIIARLWL